MKNYVVVFAVGLSLGIVLTALAGQPEVIGDSGDLFGWKVIVKHREACTSPYVRMKEREIECIK